MPDVGVLEGQLEFSDELLFTMLAQAGETVGCGRLWLRTSPFLAEVWEQFEWQFDVFARLGDPQGMYAMCFCEVE